MKSSYVAYSVISLLLLLLSSCGSKQAALVGKGDANYLYTLNDRLHETIIHDGFPPPVASRISAYANLAAYEVVCLADTSYKSFSSVYNNFNMPNIKGLNEAWDINVGVLVAFNKVSGKLTFRPYIVQQYIDSALITLQTQLDREVVENSKKIGEQIGAAVLAYSATDQYKETRNMPGFSPSGKLGSWEPTPPKYIDAIEPHWGKMRPMLLTAANQFKCAERIPFDTLPGSPMYQAALEVYNMVKDTTPEYKAIAIFWDCNPQKTNIKGHLMITVRQLTPGGHWVNIASTACENKKLGLEESSFVMALVSSTIYDAFINCWHEKFLTDVIRPETYINRYIDPAWNPLLETPVFPEHPSGHSVVSGAASTVLEHFFGTNFTFTDSTEVTFGNGIRHYTSFKQAADEAAMSRLYGGIHFRLACDDGLFMGRNIGKHALSKIGTHRSLTTATSQK